MEKYTGKRYHLHSFSDGMLTVTESDLIRYGIFGWNVIECCNGSLNWVSNTFANQVGFQTESVENINYQLDDALSTDLWLYPKDVKSIELFYLL